MLHLCIFHFSVLFTSPKSPTGLISQLAPTSGLHDGGDKLLGFRVGILDLEHWILYIVSCTLCIRYCVMVAAVVWEFSRFSTVPTFFGGLDLEHWILYIVYCMLDTRYCVLVAAVVWEFGPFSTVPTFFRGQATYDTSSYWVF